MKAVHAHEFASRWPGGARCAVAITMHFDGPSVQVGKGELPWGVRSHGRYCARCGVPRFLELFGRLAVPVTFLVPGHDAELYPALIADIAARGHEVAAHGYMHEARDPGDEEPQLLRRTHDILTRLAGTPPRGWCSPSGQKSARTMRTLRGMGYVYDASDKDHDMPYFLDGFDAGAAPGRFVMLPNNTSSLDDYPLYRLSRTPPSEVLEQWIDEYDAIHSEGRYYHLCLHPRNGYGSGTPARAAVVERLIEHMRARGGVHFTTLLGLAQWCLATPHRWETRT